MCGLDSGMDWGYVQSWEGSGDLGVRGWASSLVEGWGVVSSGGGGEGSRTGRERRVGVPLGFGP